MYTHLSLFTRAPVLGELLCRSQQLQVDSMDGGRSVWQMSFVVGGYWI